MKMYKQVEVVQKQITITFFIISVINLKKIYPLISLTIYVFNFKMRLSILWSPSTFCYPKGSPSFSYVNQPYILTTD